MRKPSITSILSMLYLIVVGATTTNAQNRHPFVIEVPFQFVVAGQTLAAGKYAVERLDPGRPSILLLKNTKNGRVRLLMTQRVEKSVPSNTSSLIFMLREGEYYLSQVWVVGDRNGNQVPASREIGTRSQDGRSTFVQLNTKKERRP